VDVEVSVDGMTPSRRPELDAQTVADRLHSAAIHLLRRLRREDDASGLSAPRLSALSVIVFGGPVTLGALAAAEQVRPPTMTRLVQGLERDGLVARVPSDTDARVVQIRATPKGTRLLTEGRARRVNRLATDLAALGAEELRLLERAAGLLERVTRADAPRPNAGAGASTRRSLAEPEPSHRTSTGPRS
jgi:DNA-binding MarR family transcriptional regulator